MEILKIKMLKITLPIRYINEFKRKIEINLWMCLNCYIQSSVNKPDWFVLWIVKWKPNNRPNNWQLNRITNWTHNNRNQCVGLRVNPKRPCIFCLCIRNFFFGYKLISISLKPKGNTFMHVVVVCFFRFVVSFF